MAKYVLIGYEKCSTCLKAKKFLEQHGVDFSWRSIVANPPTAEELTRFQAQSQLPWEKFFNTSGQVYRELNLKAQLPTLTAAEKAALLASNGKLIKRPLLIGENGVLVGFKAEQWLVVLS